MLSGRHGSYVVGYRKTTSTQLCSSNYNTIRRRRDDGFSARNVGHNITCILGIRYLDAVNEESAQNVVTVIVVVGFAVTSDDQGVCPKNLKL
jgi:hypothetical protein